MHFRGNLERYEDDTYFGEAIIMVPFDEEEEDSGVSRSIIRKMNVPVVDEPLFEERRRAMGFSPLSKHNQSGST